MAFIRSFGTLGKSDALDARALARYGAERQAREKIVEVRSFAATIDLPEVMRDAIMSAFRATLFAQLRAAGIEIAEMSA